MPPTPAEDNQHDQEGRLQQGSADSQPEVTGDISASSSPSDSGAKDSQHTSAEAPNEAQASSAEPTDEKTRSDQPADGEAWPDESADGEPEFSLAQLSEAYAEVIEAQTGVRPQVKVPEANSSTTDSDSPDQDNLQDQPDPLAACPISPDTIVESILFVGAPQGVKLTARKIASVLRDVSPKEVHQVVQRLNRKYKHENAAYRISSQDDSLEMVLEDSLIDFQQEFFGRNRQVKLSQAAVEVMALVAYNQPITREQVDKLRNKPSSSVLKQLVKRQLILPEPGKEDAKVVYYRTAERFLDLFHLDSIADLPQTHDMADIAELAD